MDDSLLCFEDAREDVVVCLELEVEALDLIDVFGGGVLRQLFQSLAHRFSGSNQTSRIVRVHNLATIPCRGPDCKEKGQPLRASALVSILAPPADDRAPVGYRRQCGTRRKPRVFA